MIDTYKHACIHTYTHMHAYIHVVYHKGCVITILYMNIYVPHYSLQYTILFLIHSTLLYYIVLYYTQLHYTIVLQTITYDSIYPNSLLFIYVSICLLLSTFPQDLRTDQKAQEEVLHTRDLSVSTSLLSCTSHIDHLSLLACLILGESLPAPQVR